MPLRGAAPQAANLKATLLEWEVYSPTPVNPVFYKFGLQPLTIILIFHEILLCVNVFSEKNKKCVPSCGCLHQVFVHASVINLNNYICMGTFEKFQIPNSTLNVLMRRICQAKKKKKQNKTNKKKTPQKNKTKQKKQNKKQNAIFDFFHNFTY